MAALPMIAQGATVTVTLTGHVLTATDGYGNLFVNTGVSTPLDKLPFSLVFTFDDALATPLISSCGGIPYYSQSSGTDTSPTAILTIGGKPFTVGGGGMGQTSGNWYALQYAALPCSSYPAGAASYSVSASYSSGGFRGASSLTDLALEGASVFPSPGSSFSSNYAWWSPLPNTNTDSSPGRALGFYINYGFNSATPSESYNVNVSGYLAPDTIIVTGPGSAACTAGATSNVIQISQALPSCPLQPKILKDGTTDITGAPPQSVMVGQRIALTALLPVGAQLAAPQPWSAEGITVGGYSPSSANFQTGSVIATDLTQGSTAFYWITPSKPGTYQVMLSCILSDGQTTTAQATFQVDGPTAPAVTTQLGLVQILGNLLSLGGDADPAVPGVTGIIFRASATLPSANPGTFQWVQLLDEARGIDTYPFGLTITCSDVSGGELDNQYPYPPPGGGPATSDSPYWPLPRFGVKLVYTFKARMFVMWNPTLPGSIPVPLGYTSWGISAEATLDPIALVWSAVGTVNPSPSFQQSPGYPTWTAVVLNRPPRCALLPPPIRTPPLRGAVFLSKYAGKPAADLFTYVSMKMPPGMP